jgi:hypothetical protein
MTTSVNVADAISTETSISNAATKAKLKHRFKQSSGITYGDLFKETAPLIYPGLDELSDQEKSKMKRRKAFVADYMDRHARAKFVSASLSFRYHNLSYRARVFTCNIRQWKPQIVS